MAINVQTLIPASSKAKEVATLADVPTLTNGTENPTSTTEPIGSVYENTTDNSIWTYTNTAPLVQNGWVPGGNPDAITAADLGPTGTTVIDGGRIDTDSLFTQDISFTGKITGGNNGAYGSDGGIIESANYVDGESGMKIDLVTGSIYIA